MIQALLAILPGGVATVSGGMFRQRRLTLTRRCRVLGTARTAEQFIKTYEIFALIAAASMVARTGRLKLVRCQ